MARRVRTHPAQVVGAVLAILLGVLGIAVGAGAQTQDETDSTQPDSTQAPVTQAPVTQAPVTQADEPPARDGTLSIRAVDGRDPDAVVVEFLYTGPRQAVSDVVLRENGNIVVNTPPVLLADDREFGIVLAIDASTSMAENAAFERTIDAAKVFVANKEPTDRIAIVSFSTVATLAQGFTADIDTLTEALDGLGVGGGTALFDAVRQSVNLFAGTDLVPNIVVLTDGGDKDSTSTLESTQALLDDAGALLFAIGVQSDTLDMGTLERLVGTTGGETLTAEAGTGLTGVYAQVQASIRRQYQTSFVSETERNGSNVLTATVGGSTTEASFQAGARLDSALDVQPIPAPGAVGISFLQGGAFFWLALVLLVLACAGAIYAIGVTVVGERSTLDAVLQPYNDGFVAPSEHEERMVTSALLQRAVDATGRFAERRGILVRIESALEQANLPLRAGESLFFYLVFLGLAIVLLWAVTANFFIALMAGVVLGLIPPAVVSFLGSRRRKKFDAQLPDMLNLLASTLRAGFSLMQGIEAAAQETTEPVKRELMRVINESRLGMPVEQALDGVVARMRSSDFEWAVMAIRIQREVGGNLAELLVTVADTMTERERLRRDVSALTAEGRVSAIVLGCLPIGLGAAMFAINPEYIGGLFDDSFGLILVAASGLLMAAGFAWMLKIIDIEV